MLLEDVLADAGHLVLPARRLAPNGLDAWAQVLASGCEGYVAKDLLSPFRGGVTPLVAQGEGARLDRPGRPLEAREARRRVVGHTVSSSAEASGERRACSPASRRCAITAVD